MQLCLFGCALVDWLSVFYMMYAILRRSVVPWNMHRNLLSMSGMKRKISYIVCKGEKQIQILDGY
jgi:hypothetical protein